MGNKQTTYEEIDKKSKQIIDILEIASRQGNLEIIRYIIENNPEIEYKNRSIYFVSIYGHNDCVQYLLNNGTNPNLQTNNGITPLIWTSSKGHTECVNALLNAGANPNIQDTDGWTALMDTSRRNDINCVKLLLKAGANPYIKNKKNFNAFDCSIIRNNKNITKILKRIIVVHFLLNK